MIKIQRALLVERSTDYEVYKATNTLANVSDIELILKLHKLHKSCCDTVESLLKEGGWNVTRVPITQLSIYKTTEFDLLVSAGGDGTLLKVAQIAREQLVLGINTIERHDNYGSLGGLCTLRASEVGKLEELITGYYSVEEWERLGARVNGTELPYLALNEVAIGPKRFYGTVHINVEFLDVSEYFIGSGLIVATARGSTAWFTSLTNGHRIHPKLKAYGIAAIDPFEKRLKYKWHSITVPADTITKVTPLRPGVELVFDSLAYTTHKLAPNDRVEVYVSSQPLRVVRV
ncbi:NAD(+)/NADH kinase [Candidatus Woesearchaeota archaeon]|nr:NAD(+)/NADH kinase [Candidatus Woesearchaeota archaeon]